MMNLSKWTYLIIFIISSSFVFAQKVVNKSDLAQMPWMNGDMPVKNNHSYEFKLVYGEANSLTKAKDAAITSLIMELANEQGINVSSKSIHEISTQSKNEFYNETVKTNHTYKIDRDDFKSVFEKVDEYWEQYSNKRGVSEYRCWILFAVAKNPDQYSFDKFQFTSRYGVAPIWRSALVPGWGQLYKKQKTKGIAIFSAEILMLSGALTSEYLRSNYHKKALETKNIDLRRDYISKSDAFSVSRNIMFVLAGGIYIYNIIDAVSSKGARHYAQNRPFDFRIYSNQEYYALGFSYKF